MVVNGSRRLLDDRIWGRILQTMILTGEKKLPRYIPGLLMFPDPEAGCISGYVDIAYLATSMYPILAAVYLIAAGLNLDVTIFSDDSGDYAKHPSNGLYLLGALLLMVDVFLCFWDLYIEHKHQGVSSLNSAIRVEGDELILVSEVSTGHSILYLFNNLFFLAAAIIYLIQALWAQNHHTDIYGCYKDTWCGTFWTSVWGSLNLRTCYLLPLYAIFITLKLYTMCFLVISAIFCLIQGCKDYKVKQREKLRNSDLFTFDKKRFNWFLWGDIFFVTVMSMFLLQPFFLVFKRKDKYTDQNDAIYYFITNVVLFFDAVLYQIGYHAHVQDLRDSIRIGMDKLFESDSFRGFCASGNSVPGSTADKNQQVMSILNATFSATHINRSCLLQGEIDGQYSDMRPSTVELGCQKASFISSENPIVNYNAR